MACGESADKRSGKDDPTRGVGVRACVQCGLSISETATFCQVCGARFDVDAGAATLEATQVVEGPPADAEPAGGGDRWAEAQPYEPGAELVADLGAGSEPAEPGTAGASDRDADVSAGREPAEAAPEMAEPEAAPEAPAPEMAEPEALKPDVPESEVPAPGPVELEPAPEPSARDRKLAAVAVLLEAASGCEDADVSRAAALYQEAILGCLDAADGDGGFAGVERELLRGFDGLSALLERRGLAEEALEVVDDAAALGLLNGGEHVPGGHGDALLARREDLRRLLYVDSANL
jgi:hypothetical protein